jgi:hypothetical protein
MTNLDVRKFLALLCAELLIFSQVGCGGHRVALPEVRPPSQVFEPLNEELKKSYLMLFETAPKLEYSDAEIVKMQEYLKQAQDYCTGRFESVANEYQRRIDDAQKGLKKSGITNEERHNLHCSIRDARVLHGQADVIAQNAIPVAYDNKGAKLELIQNWPVQLKEIRASVADGTYKARRGATLRTSAFAKLRKIRKTTSSSGERRLRT